MQKLLLGTNNPGKVHELRALLDSLPVDLVTPADLGLQLQVPEEGDTYADNATRKARSFCQASRTITLADDSGLEVEVLGGQPGLHSARFSPRPDATDADRRQLLLARLRVHPQPWRARFVSAVAVAAPSGELHLAEGVCPGRVVAQEWGHRGFGYDPIFLIDGTGKTMAELSLATKNRLSHRARAVQNTLPWLRRYLEGHPAGA